MDKVITNKRNILENNDDECLEPWLRDHQNNHDEEKQEKNAMIMNEKPWLEEQVGDSFLVDTTFLKNPYGSDKFLIIYYDIID
jgi:hypothetical protein